MTLGTSIGIWADSIKTKSNPARKHISHRGSIYRRRVGRPPFTAGQANPQPARPQGKYTVAQRSRHVSEESRPNSPRERDRAGSFRRRFGRAESAADSRPVTAARGGPERWNRYLAGPGPSRSRVRAGGGTCPVTARRSLGRHRPPRPPTRYYGRGTPLLDG